MNTIKVISEIKQIPFTEIAKKLNVTKQQVSMWVNNKRPVPNKYVPKLCEILGADENTLTGNIDDQTLLNLYEQQVSKILNREVVINFK